MMAEASGDTVRQPVHPALSFETTWVDSVPSTNDLVLDRIRSGTASAGEVWAAREQPAARGRQGRHWVASAGGLWFTVALPLAADALGWAGMLPALAVCEALDELGLGAGVKWPNDVVIERRKLAGILVESVAGRELAAVGIGLNVRNDISLPHAAGSSASASRAWPPTSVHREAGSTPEPEPLLAPILARLEALWRLWMNGTLELLRERWTARDVGRGAVVRLLPDGPAGVAESIDRAGALQVRLSNGTLVRAVAGELVFI
jgi:BirA family transcriptional regulator, biotin operon repressor / biotin---[acetyl-CoA-carboxylase] ligase